MALDGEDGLDRVQGLKVWGKGFDRGVDAGRGRAWEVDFRCKGFRFGD